MLLHVTKYAISQNFINMPKPKQMRCCHNMPSCGYFKDEMVSLSQYPWLYAQRPEARYPT